MIRALYSLAWRLAIPLTPLRLAWRGRREPGYFERMGERYGFYRDPPLDGETVWLHGASVGETRAASPLVERIARERPGAKIVLTTLTATGRETGRALFGDRVVQYWIPYDLPGAMRRLLAHIRPRFGVLMETEYWPNLVAEATQAGVPIVAANARMGEGSARGYARVRSLATPMFAALAGVAAQSPDDARRFVALGVRSVTVTGNLKFDAAVPPDAVERAAAMHRLCGPARRVFVAASTREGEEALIVDALARRPLPPGTLLVIVPRHPQRFADVAALLEARGVAHVRRSAGRPPGPEEYVMLGDSMGEMWAYYGAADLAFIGGSLVPLGGQNLIEALAMGTPVIVGPHTFNFADAAADAIAAGAALRVADADAMVDAAASLITDDARRRAMSEAAPGFLALHRGATDRTWAYMVERLGLKDASSAQPR